MKSVNVANAELAPTPSITPNRTDQAAVIRGIGGELGAFLSLVARFLEKTPPINPGQIEPSPSTPSSGTQRVQSIKNKSKDSILGSNKNAKPNEKEETSAVTLPVPHSFHEPSALLFPAQSLLESAAFIMNPDVAFEVSTHGPDLPAPVEQPTSDKNKKDGGPVPRIDVARGPTDAAFTAVVRDVAFTLRLTPEHSETKIVPQAVLPTVPLAAGNSVTGLSPVPVTKPGQGSDSHSSGDSILARGVTSEVDGPGLAASKAFPPIPAQFGNETGSKPRQKDEPGVSPTQTAPARINAQIEPTPVPKNMESAVAWSCPQPPRQHPESADATQLPEEAEVTLDQPLKFEAHVVADSQDTLAHPRDTVTKTNSAMPVIPRSPARTNSADEPGPRQPETKESKLEPPAKQAVLENHFSDGKVGNATALAPAAPLSEAIATPTAVGRPGGTESLLRVQSEPEAKMVIAPPPTRQISLKLSTDDSTRVNVDLTERAGRVLVAVRTPDHQLAQSLQTDLGDLVGRLESKGFKTDVWTPALAHPSATPSHPSNSNTGFGQPQHSGSGNGGEQQRHWQSGSNQRQRARWTAQLEQTLSTNEARSES